MKNSYIKFQWENDAFTLNITLMTLTFIFKIKNTETVKMKILSVVLFTSRAMRALKRSWFWKMVIGTWDCGTKTSYWEEFFNECEMLKIRPAIATLHSKAAMQAGKLSLTSREGTESDENCTGLSESSLPQQHFASLSSHRCPFVKQALWWLSVGQQTRKQLENKSTIVCTRWSATSNIWLQSCVRWRH